MRVQKAEKRDSEISVDNRGRVTITHTESFRLEFDAATTSAIAQQTLIDQESLFPGMPNPDDPRCGLQKLKVTQIAGRRNPWQFTADLTFSNQTPDPSEVESDNPLDSPAEVRWDDGEMEIAIDKDRDGRPILLPNKRYFDPPITKLVTTGRLVIKRPERVLDVDPENKYRMHVNANEFAGKPPETLMLKSITSHMEYKNGVRYYPTEYVFEYNPETWNPDVLAADVMELNSEGKRVHIKDDRRVEVAGPVPIDENGKAIPEDDLPDDAYYIEVKKYKEANFEELGLPV